MAVNYQNNVKVKELKVKVTYIATVRNIEIPEKVFDELQEGFDECAQIESPDYSSSWLADNIRESNCHDCTYEIQVMNT